MQRPARPQRSCGEGWAGCCISAVGRCDVSAASGTRTTARYAPPVGQNAEFREAEFRASEASVILANVADMRSFAHSLLKFNSVCAKFG
jgi:hypothetical protein